MEVQFELKGTKGSFYIEQDGRRLGEMVFSQPEHSDFFIIEHTDVDDALRGTGAGKKMFIEAVNYARKNNLKILPLCPFAKSIFDKSREYDDVLKR